MASQKNVTHRLSSTSSNFGTILLREGRGCIGFVPLRMLHSSTNSTWRRHVCVRHTVSYSIYVVTLDLAKNSSCHPTLSDFIRLRPLIRSQKVLVVPGSWPWQLCAASLWLCNWAASRPSWCLVVTFVYFCDCLSLRQMVNISTRWRWTERPVQNEGRSVKEISKPSRHATGNGAGNLN